MGLSEATDVFSCACVCTKEGGGTESIESSEPNADRRLSRSEIRDPQQRIKQTLCRCNTPDLRQVGLKLLHKTTTTGLSAMIGIRVALSRWISDLSRQPDFTMPLISALVPPA